MLSLSESHGDKKLVPIATISYSTTGIGADPMIDLNGVKIYLDKEYFSYDSDTKFIHGKEEFDEKFPGVLREEKKSVDDSFFKYGRDGRKMKKKDILSMKDILSKKSLNDDDEKYIESKSYLAKMYSRAKKKEEEFNQDIGKYLFLNEGHVFPMPEVRVTKEGEKNFRQTYHVAGRADSGKSTWSAKLVRLWKDARQKLGLSDSVYIFSRVEADHAYRTLGAINILINEELLENPIDTNSELHNCLVIFDDIDKIIDKDLKNYMCKLRNDLLQTGSHTGTYIITTCHHLFDWSNTRDALNEAHYITLFPMSDKPKIKEFMIKMLGIDKHRADEIANLPSRWLTFYVRVPSFVVHERGVILL